MPREPRFLFFDLGRVLYDFDYGRFRSRIREASRLENDQLSALLADETLLVRYETGELPTSDFFRMVRSRFALEVDEHRLRQGFNDIFTPLAANLEAVADAASRHPVGILSNTSESHIQFLSEKTPLLRQDSILRIYSFETGARKPDEAIYRKAMRSSGAEPAQIWFIDDLAPNVETAARLGWQAVHYLPGSPLRDYLVADGLLDS